MPRYELLSGIRILDISVALSGPFASQILADLGAEVIKIEAPEVGDTTRDTVPRIGERDGYYFMSLNRNKKSLAVDLQTPSGRQDFGFGISHQDQRISFHRDPDRVAFAELSGEDAI